jgi:hypothetical protein
MRRFVGATAVCVIGALSRYDSVSAAMLGHQWVEVNNSRTTGSQAPSGLDDGTLDGIRYRTFDLYLVSDAPLFIMDSGITQSSGANPGLSLANAVFFQRSSFGSPNHLPPTTPATTADPIVEFDSYIGLGARSAPSILVAQPISFENAQVRGTWSTLPGSGGEAPGPGGRIFFGRFTVSSALGRGSDESASRSLAGTVFAFPQGAAVGQTIQISNAFAIPGPNAAALLLIGSTLVLRRRRVAR